MKTTLLISIVALAALAGCGGDDRKAIPPAGPMTPPGPGAEQEGGKGKEKKANVANEG